VIVLHEQIALGVHATELLQGSDGVGVVKHDPYARIALANMLGYDLNSLGLGTVGDNNPFPLFVSLVLQTLIDLGKPFGVVARGEYAY
jgi:hypothetical protein